MVHHGLGWSGHAIRRGEYLSQVGRPCFFAAFQIEKDGSSFSKFSRLKNVGGSFLGSLRAIRAIFAFLNLFFHRLAMA